jgi:hypothetical protein
MQTPPGCNGFRCIARMPGSPLLQLKQVDISTPSDVEGMFARTDHSPFVAHQAQMAAAHGAQEHSTSVTNGECRLDRLQTLPPTDKLNKRYSTIR